MNTNSYYRVGAGYGPAQCGTMDNGPMPYVADIEKETLANPYFRRALWTGTHLQLTLMCIPAGGEIGLENHPNLDQFLHIVEGDGLVMMGERQNMLRYRRQACDGTGVFIPAGTWHNLVNTSNRPIKLYSVYSPVQHPHGTIHETKAVADAAENGSQQVQMQYGQNYRYVPSNSCY